MKPQKFFSYVLPSMLAFALSGIYSIADGFFVGNAIGDQALAAINIAYPLTAFLQSAGTGIGMGGAVQYTICMGRGDSEKTKQYFGASIGLLFGTGLILTALFLLWSPFLLKLFGAEGDTQSLGEEYIRFISYGAVFQVFSTGLVPFIRNMGGTVWAMAAMAAGFVTNIGLDYLFVWRFPFGMAGAAVATVLGQGVTLLVCLLFFVKKHHKPVFPACKTMWSMAKKIGAVGLSPFGLTFSPNIMLIFINKSAALWGGNFAVTCYAAVSYISCVVLLLLQGISDGCQPLISLAYGKGSWKEAKYYRNLSYGFSLAVSLLCILFLFAVRDRAASLFGASAQVTAGVAFILPIFIVGFLFVSISRTTIAYFYASERNGKAYFLIYGESVCLFLALLFLPGKAGIEGVWLSVPLSQFLMTVFSFFLLGIRRKKQS